jgi:hypothetical protein
MNTSDMVVVPERYAEYEEWIQQHPDGYVINAPRSSSEPMYCHRADCDHIQPYGVTKSGESEHTIKACSLNPGALAEWAVHRGGALKYCETCRDKWLKEQSTMTTR